MGFKKKLYKFRPKDEKHEIEVTVRAPDGRELTLIAPAKVKVRSLLRKASEELEVNLEDIAQSEGAFTSVILSDLDSTLEDAGLRSGSKLQISSVPEEDLIRVKKSGGP